MYVSLILQDYCCFRGRNELQFCSQAGITAVMGDNGVGKSTFLRAIATLCGVLHLSAAEPTTLLRIEFNDNECFHVNSTGFFINEVAVSKQLYTVKILDRLPCQFVDVNLAWRQLFDDPREVMDFLVNQFAAYSSFGNVYDPNEYLEARNQLETVEKEVSRLQLKRGKLRTFLRKITKSKEFWNHLEALEGSRAALISEREALARQITTARNVKTRYQIRELEGTAASLEVKRESIQKRLDGYEHEVMETQFKLDSLNEDLANCLADIRVAEARLQASQFDTSDDLKTLSCLKIDFIKSRCDFLRAEIELDENISNCASSCPSTSESVVGEHPIFRLTAQLIRTHRQSLHAQSEMIAEKLGLLGDGEKAALSRTSAQISALNALRLSIEEHRAKYLELKVALANLFPRESSPTEEPAGSSQSILLQYPQILGTPLDFLTIPNDSSHYSQLNDLLRLALHKKTQKIYVVKMPEDALMLSREIEDAIFIPYKSDGFDGVISPKSQYFKPSFKEKYPDIRILSEMVQAPDEDAQRIAVYAFGDYIIAENQAQAQDIASHRDWYPRDMIVCDYEGNTYSTKGGLISAPELPISPETLESAEMEVLSKYEASTLLLNKHLAMESVLLSRIAASERTEEAYKNLQTDFLSLQNDIAKSILHLKFQEKELNRGGGESLQKAVFRPRFELAIRIVTENAKDEFMRYTRQLAEIEHQARSPTNQSQAPFQEDLSESLKILRQRLDVITDEITDLSQYQDSERAVIRQLTCDLNATDEKVQTLRQRIRHLESAIIGSVRGEDVSHELESSSQGNIGQMRRRLYQIEADLKSLNSAFLSATQVHPSDLAHEEEAQVSDLAELDSEMSVLKDRQSLLAQRLNAFSTAKQERLCSILVSVKHNLGRVYSTLTSSKGEVYLDFCSESNPDLGVIFRVTPASKSSSSSAVEQLSGGEFTVAVLALHIAILLAKGGSLLLLDEVDASLDGDLSGRLCDFLVQSDIRYKLSVVLVTRRRSLYRLANQFVGIYRLEEGAVPTVYLND